MGQRSFSSRWARGRPSDRGGSAAPPKPLLAPPDRAGHGGWTLSSARRVREHLNFGRFGPESGPRPSQRDANGTTQIEKHLTARFMRRTFQDLGRQAQVHDFVVRAISGRATVAMQDRYSSVGGDEVRAGLAKVISLVSHLDDAGRKSGDQGGTGTGISPCPPPPPPQPPENLRESCGR